MRGFAVLQRLADSDDLSPEVRDEVRKLLAPVLTGVEADVARVSQALTGPDPEFAIFLARQALRTHVAALRKADARLQLFLARTAFRRRFARLRGLATGSSSGPHGRRNAG